MAMNEADTRANLIDPKLVSAGWGMLREALFAVRSTLLKGVLLVAVSAAVRLSAIMCWSTKAISWPLLKPKKKASATPKACVKPRTTPVAYSAVSVTQPTVI